jgi:hypothetical protein
MSKRISAKIGEYEKDGETKGIYAEVGVLMKNDNGYFILLNPHFNPAAAWISQRIMNPDKAGDRVMCGVYDNNRQGESKPQATQQGAPKADFDDSIPF